MEVYRKQKQSLSIFVLPSSLTRLRLSFKMFSNLELNIFNWCPTKIDAGVKIQLYPATIGRPTIGFPIYTFLTLKIQPPFLHMAFYTPF